VQEKLGIQNRHMVLICKHFCKPTCKHQELPDFTEKYKTKLN